MYIIFQKGVDNFEIEVVRGAVPLKAYFIIYECCQSSRFCQITNLWYNSGHLDLLLLMAAVSHHIQDMLNKGGSLRHTLTKAYDVAIKKIPKRLPSPDN